MSIHKKVVKGAIWLSLFKLIGQIFTWIVTIQVARILLPSDYGLMELSTILTGYAAYFSELGLGAAIIQKKTVSDDELSSIFWFVLCVSILLYLVCYFGAYYMAYIFDNPRIIPLIQVIAIAFPINSLYVVPHSLLSKHFAFKKSGLVELKSVIISSIAMLVIAYNGGGVWTLVSGILILSSAKVILIYTKIKWFPRLHFNYQEAKSYLNFGINVFAGRTFFYIFEKSDKYFGGRSWTPQTLGYYSFALQLAQIPTEKIATLINQVSYPVFSKLQSEQDEFNKFYLNVVNITSIIVLPLFVGGFLTSEEIIKVLLNEKWYPIIFIFKWLCLSQIITSLNAVNSFVHYSQGRPNWSLYFHALLAIFMGFSFYYAVEYGLNAILIPWFTTYLLICTIWTVVTLKKINIDLTSYIKNLFNPVMAVIVMATGVILIDIVFNNIENLNTYDLIQVLLAKITAGVILYIGYLWIFNRQIFHQINDLRKK